MSYETLAVRRREEYDTVRVEGRGDSLELVVKGRSELGHRGMAFTILTREEWEAVKAAGDRVFEEGASDAK